METDTARAGRRARTADTAEQTADTPVVAPASDETAEQQPQADAAAPPAAGDETTVQASASPVAEQDPVGAAVDAWFAGFNDSALSRNPEFWGLVQGRLPELKAAIGAVPTA